MAGFWERLEDRILALQKDRKRAAKLYLIAYWISLAVVMLGAILIVLNLAGWWGA